MDRKSSALIGIVAVAIVAVVAVVFFSFSKRAAIAPSTPLPMLVSPPMVTEDFGGRNVESEGIVEARNPLRQVSVVANPFVAETNPFVAETNPFVAETNPLKTFYENPFQ